MNNIWMAFFFGLSAVAVAAPFLQSAKGVKLQAAPREGSMPKAGWTEEELRMELALGKLNTEEFNRIAAEENYDIKAASADRGVEFKAPEASKTEDTGEERRSAPSSS
jgi:hypothetical protein